MINQIHLIFPIHLRLLFHHRHPSRRCLMDLSRLHPLQFPGWREFKSFSRIHPKYRTFWRNYSVLMRTTKCRRRRSLKHNLTCRHPQRSILKLMFLFIMRRSIHRRYVTATATNHHVRRCRSHLVLNRTIHHLLSCKATEELFRHYKHPIGVSHRQLRRAINQLISNRQSIDRTPLHRQHQSITALCHCMLIHRPWRRYNHWVLRLWWKSTQHIHWPQHLHPSFHWSRCQSAGPSITSNNTL